MKKIAVCLVLAFVIIQTPFFASSNHSEKLIRAGQKGGIFIHGAPLYIRADAGSKKLARLPIGTIVEIISIGKTYERIGDVNGRWAKVKAHHRVPEESAEYKDKKWSGYVHSASIVTTRMLESNTSWWGMRNFVTCSSDVCVRYVFNHDGTYEGFLYDWNNDEHQRVPKGNMYQYNQLIFLGSGEDENSFMELIVMDRSGAYCFDYHIIDNGLCWKP